jgi:hypothetical protein
VPSAASKPTEGCRFVKRIDYEQVEIFGRRQRNRRSTAGGHSGYDSRAECVTRIRAALDTEANNQRVGAGSILGAVAGAAIVGAAVVEASRPAPVFYPQTTPRNQPMCSKYVGWYWVDGQYIAAPCH